MKIPEFVDRISNRYDTKLQTNKQIEDFNSDCKGQLKFYEGDVLGYVYEEILATQRSRTHPVIAVIRDLCTKKAAGDRVGQKKTDIVEIDKYHQANALIKQFMASEQYKYCAENMIAGMALTHIKKHSTKPERRDIERMLREHDIFMQKMHDIKNNPELSETETTLFKMGKGIYLNSLNRLLTNRGLPEISHKVKDVSFTEHEQYRKIA